MTMNVEERAAAVLILQSSCTISSNFLANDNPISNSKHKDLLNDVESLPLWCDLTILPEIPYDYEATARRMAASVHLVPQQSLNSCGLDNVILLHGLPPAVADIYLLSIHNCFTIQQFNQTTPVHTAPSTFSFKLEGIIQHNYFGENDQESSFLTSNKVAELDIAFDFSSVVKFWSKSKQGENVYQHENETALTSIQQLDDSVSQQEQEQQKKLITSPDYVVESREGNHSEKVKNDEAPALQQKRTSYLDKDVLRVLELTIEREAQQLDQMLLCLGLTLLCLLLPFCWILVELIRKNYDTKRPTTKKASKRHQHDTNNQAPSTSATNRNDPTRLKQEKGRTCPHEEARSSSDLDQQKKVSSDEQEQLPKCLSSDISDEIIDKVSAESKMFDAASLPAVSSSKLVSAMEDDKEPALLCNEPPITRSAPPKRQVFSIRKTNSASMRKTLNESASKSKSSVVANSTFQNLGMELKAKINQRRLNTKKRKQVISPHNPIQTEQASPEKKEFRDEVMAPQSRSASPTMNQKRRTIVPVSEEDEVGDAAFFNDYW